MPHKFQKGDPVFHKGEGYTSIRGFYNVTEVGRNGDIYRVTDMNGDFTDADEEELEAIEYAVFTRLDYGWPIIIPVYDEPLFNSYIDSNRYEFICRGQAKVCIDRETEILKELESASH